MWSPFECVSQQDGVETDSDMFVGKEPIHEGKAKDAQLTVLVPISEWVPDNATEVCQCCQSIGLRTHFGLFTRRHHCRKCGQVVCGSCSQRSFPLLQQRPLRVCNTCYSRVLPTPLKEFADRAEEEQKQLLQSEMILEQGQERHKGLRRAPPSLGVLDTLKQGVLYCKRTFIGSHEIVTTMEDHTPELRRLHYDVARHLLPNVLLGVQTLPDNVKQLKEMLKIPTADSTILERLNRLSPNERLAVAGYANAIARCVDDSDDAIVEQLQLVRVDVWQESLVYEFLPRWVPEWSWLQGKPKELKCFLFRVVVSRLGAGKKASFFIDQAGRRFSSIEQLQSSRLLRGTMVFYAHSLLSDGGEFNQRMLMVCRTNARKKRWILAKAAGYIAFGIFTTRSLASTAILVAGTIFTLPFTIPTFGVYSLLTIGSTCAALYYGGYTLVRVLEKFRYGQPVGWTEWFSLGLSALSVLLGLAYPSIAHHIVTTAWQSSNVYALSDGWRFSYNLLAGSRLVLTIVTVVSFCSSLCTYVNAAWIERTCPKFGSLRLWWTILSQLSSLYLFENNLYAGGGWRGLFAGGLIARHTTGI